MKDIFPNERRMIMADTKFMNYTEVTPGSADSVLVANSANGVRRSTIDNLVQSVSTSVFNSVFGRVLSAAGLNYNVAPIGYISFGTLFGGLILQWGYVQIRDSYTLPISFSGKGSYIGVASSDTVSGGNVGFNKIDGQTITLTQEPGKESYRTYFCIGR